MEKNFKNLAIFDFCGTLVKDQTADLFIMLHFLRKLNLIKFIQIFFIKSLVYDYLAKIFKNLSLDKKKLILKMSRKISYEEFYKSAHFFSFYLKYRFIKSTKILLQEHLEKNDLVVISSAGYGIYLRIFFKKNFMNKKFIIISSELKFKNMYFTGNLEGNDNYGKEKVINLKKYIDFNNFHKVFVYTDSESDLPILGLASEKFVVTNKPNQKWIKKINPILLNN
tara:strand:- start:15640 stop:16311 length:672 start_codon:yes stop_codon:yes gene_type:complete